MAEIYNFFGDIFDYLRETYFEVDFGTYQNFDIGTYAGSLSGIIFAVMLGIVLASCAVFIERRYLGALVRALVKDEARDEESAKTLADLGLRPNFLLKNALRRRDSALRKLVRYAGEPSEEEDLPEEVTGREKKRLIFTEMLDFSTTRFYIPPALCDRATIRYNEKGSDFRSLVLTVLIAIVGSGVLIRFLPVVFHVADNMITWFGA